MDNSANLLRTQSREVLLGRKRTDAFQVHELASQRRVSSAQFSKHGWGLRSLCISWECVRNANSQTTTSGLLRWGPAMQCLQSLTGNVNARFPLSIADLARQRYRAGVGSSRLSSVSEQTCRPGPTGKTKGKSILSEWQNWFLVESSKYQAEKRGHLG